MNILTINHISYQVSRTETELNIQPHYVQYQLAKNIEGMNGENYDNNKFWAQLFNEDTGVETRYAIVNNEFIETMKFNTNK